MADMDWLDDDAMSPEETMRRFEALDPESTVGPPRNGRTRAIREWARAHDFSVSDVRVAEPRGDAEHDGEVVAR